MEARIKWLEGASFEATSGSGHRVVLDGAELGYAEAEIDALLATEVVLSN